MSLYRQAGGRNIGTIAAWLIAALLLGGLGGFLFGKGSVDEPPLTELVADARAELAPAAAGLELVPVEYGSSVRGGRVVEPTEYGASRAAAGRAADALAAAAEDMRAVDAAGYAAATHAMRLLEDSMQTRAPASRVDSLARAAAGRVETLAGD